VRTRYDLERFGVPVREERHALRRSEHGDQQTDPTAAFTPGDTGRHALEWVVAFPGMRNDKRRPRTCDQTVMSRKIEIAAVSHLALSK
jgi:hypothetical protein